MSLRSASHVPGLGVSGSGLLLFQSCSGSGFALVRLLFLLCQARLELRSELGEGRKPFHAFTVGVWCIGAMGVGGQGLLHGLMTHGLWAANHERPRRDPVVALGM